MGTLVEDISKLEMAAQVMMAPPNQVTAEHRRDAERVFLDFKENILPFITCREILEHTQNHFLMFEVVQVLTTSVLKQWQSLSEEDVLNICNYLIHFPISNLGVPHFVVTEFLRSFAIILKRSSVESSLLSSNFLDTTIEGFLQNSEEQMQSFGLQVIESISSEFASNCRSSYTTWDFNTRAKKQFENILLKKFLKISLSTLSRLLSHTDLSSPVHLKICDKFLRVAIGVLSWNFSSKIISTRFRTVVSGLKSNSFKPPLSWSDIFEDTSIVAFFMQLHNKVRHNEELSINSLNCLAQLASVMGDVLEPVDSDNYEQLSPSASHFLRDKQTQDRYVQVFVVNMIEIFSQLHEYEMLPLSLIVYKLFTHHPMSVFARFPADLLSQFVIFLSRTIVNLTGPAIEFAIDKDEHIYHEALHNFYQTWRTLLRSADLFLSVKTLILSQNTIIIEEFFSTVLAQPYGRRQQLTEEEEILNENEDEKDDRDVFMDLLGDLGYFSMYSVDSCTSLITRTLGGRFNQFMTVTNDVSIEKIRLWQEDLHWIFLILGFQFQQRSFDCISNLPEEMAQRCLAGYRSGEFVRVDLELVLQRCLIQPLDSELLNQKLDPVTLITFYVFSWSVLEHNALETLGTDAALISPQLTRSSLWLIARMIASLSPRVNDVIPSDSKDNMERTDEKLLPHIPVILSNALQQIVEFILSKVFVVLTRLPGEERLCADAIELIILFSDYYAEALTQSDHLYILLSRISLENLRSRRSLIKSLVVIGSAVASAEIREKMFSTILKPLETKFLSLCSFDLTDQTVLSQLVDLFECFSGVADAGQSEAAPVLFAFLQPVFKSSVHLMSKYSDSQLLVNSILVFFKTVTDVLFFYIESSDECSTFHGYLLGIIEAYRVTQTQKYQRIQLSATADDEELENQTKDLITLIEILCHSVSKTFMPTVDGAGSVENSAKVALLGLEIILPLMNEELLKIPSLCSIFFCLLLFISDLAANVMARISDQMLMAFLQCLSLALHNQFGSERLKCALEIVNNMASHLSVDRSNPSLASNFIGLTPQIFETTLEYGHESGMFDEASNALYSLIALNRDNFSAYVVKLMQRPENAHNAEKIQEAFCKLLPATDPLEIGRVEKRIFRDRMEIFLTEIYGLLYL